MRGLFPRPNDDALLINSIYDLGCTLISREMLRHRLQRLCGPCVDNARVFWCSPESDERLPVRNVPSLDLCSQLFVEDWGRRRQTILLGEPLGEAFFDFLLRLNPASLRALDASTDLLENVEVILNILNGTVFRQSLNQGFDFLFDSAQVVTPRQTF